MKVEDVAKDIDNNEAKKEDKEIKINIETEDIKDAKVIKEDKIVSFKDIKMKFERGEDETKDEESKELTPVRKRMMERRL